MLRYSTENIYSYSGQFDKVVSVTFGYKTKSRELYGDFITGIFIYTKEERLELENRIKKQSDSSTDGYVRFNELLKDIPDEKRNQLLKEGILASDIVSILQSNFGEENQFAKTETRELPKPMEINVDFSDVDPDKIILGLNDSRLKSGFKLTPDEIDQHNSIIYKKFKDRISKEDFEKLFIDQQTGKVKAGIYYHALKSEYFKGKLSKEQEEEFQKVFAERTKDRMKILKDELEKSTQKLKELGITYGKSLKSIYYISLWFEPERLTHNKFPVWWDYERFIHIFLRHVSETQVGERFEEKTVFQYKLKDIKSLIELVLKHIDEEIQRHFTLTPTDNFKRHGEMAVYYNGDYYNIHIEPTGRLMTFYKQSIEGNKAIAKPV